MRKNRFLDVIPDSQSASAGELQQVDRTVTGTVSEILGDGVVAVSIDGSTEPDVVVSSASGITAVGASVRVSRDSSGRAVEASIPDHIPYGAPVMAVGVTGEWLASLDSAQAGLDGRMDQADEAIAQNASDITQAQTDIAGAKQVAEQAAQVADDAQSAAAQAATDAQTAKSAADGAASKADQAAADLLALAGKSGRVIRSATEPTGDDRNSNNLWLNTGNGQLSQWTGSAWQVVTDSRLTAAANAADQAKNLADAAQESADAADAKAVAAQSAADAASSAAQTAQAAATAAQSTADAAQTQASSAASAAATAQGTANQAKTDAAAAAGIAGGKADVLIQDAEPATSMRKATTLWIDTTGGGNKPKRWSGSAWVVVTDKVATDAAAAAASAQGTADQAVTAAAAAKSTADAAQAAALAAQSTADTAASKATTADGRYTVATANPTASDASGKPIGAVWEVRSGGTALRRYVLTASTTWTQVKVGQDFVGDKAIGQAQIGDLAVGTAQIANISVTDAKIGTMSVGKLVAGSANVDSAVVQKLSVAIATVIELGVDRLVAGTGTLNEATAKKLWADIATFGDVTVTNQMIVNTLVGKVLQGGLLRAGGGDLPQVLVGPLSGQVGTGDQYGISITTPNNNANGSAVLGVAPTGPFLEFYDGTGALILAADKAGVRVINQTDGGMVDLSKVTTQRWTWTLSGTLSVKFNNTSGVIAGTWAFFHATENEQRINSVFQVSSPTGRLRIDSGVRINQSGGTYGNSTIAVQWGLYTSNPDNNDRTAVTSGLLGNRGRAECYYNNTATPFFSGGSDIVDVTPNQTYWVRPFYRQGVMGSSETKALTNMWVSVTPA